jgi:REP element-mobilizing transposase RayT
MARARKRHIQQAMFDRSGRVIGANGKPTGRGGYRPNAGRKPKGARAGAPHKRRPTLKSWQPVHIVLRVVGELGNLRKRDMYKAVRNATISVAKRELHDERDGAFRIVHISIQRNHVHLIVEADHKRALSRGMQSFQISAAKHLNRAFSIVRIKNGARIAGHTVRLAGNLRAFSATAANLLLKLDRGARRRGTVFPDRYHEEIITNPKQAHHALAYVLNNWRKHGEDRTAQSRAWNVDPFSTGVLFDGWKEREHDPFVWSWRDTYQPMVVYLARTWLLREGWRKHGLIGFHYVPSAKQMRKAAAAARQPSQAVAR